MVTETAVPTETMAPTATPTAAVPELSYMEKYQDFVVVKPEESIYKEQSGVEYTEEKEYPVLYILHGFWDNEEWI